MVDLEKSKCIVCQSDLRTSSEVAFTIYECGLVGKNHYRMYINHSPYLLDKVEEKAIIIMNNLEYEIIQYSDPGCYLIISQFDLAQKYVNSVIFELSVPPFDFLNNDLKKVVEKIKTLLTFG